MMQPGCLTGEHPYASGNQLAMVSLETESHPLCHDSGPCFWLRWSPNGKLLRFTLIDSVNHASSLWRFPEINVQRDLSKGLSLSQMNAACLDSER